MTAAEPSRLELLGACPLLSGTATVIEKEGFLGAWG